MASAVVQVSIFSCSATTPIVTSGETTGFCFNTLDSRSLTSGPIQIPTGGAGTDFSWPKYLGLDVTSTGTTNIENRQAARSSACPAGLVIYWASTANYVEPSSAVGNTGAADGADPDAGTTNWTALTTSYAAYSTASAATVAGINGKYLILGLGVSSTGAYTGGAGTAIALPNILLQYDES